MDKAFFLQEDALFLYYHDFFYLVYELKALLWLENRDMAKVNYLCIIFRRQPKILIR